MTTTDKLDFRRSGVQFYNQRPWYETDRACEYLGQCQVCHTRCYGFQDGQDDPRGPLGDHAASELIASDHYMIGPDIMMCFMCANDEPRYNKGLRRAYKVWKPGNKTRYEIDGVLHIYCIDCLPKEMWLFDMTQANRLKYRKLTTQACDSCGDAGP